MENRRPITYTFEDIKRYRQGLMNREEMHAFEKASMEDPFLADALEGYMQADMALAEEHLNNTRERITDKEAEKEKAVVVAMPQKRFAFMRVAAMVIVIAGAGLLTYKIFDKKDTSADQPLARVDTPATTETKPAGETPQAAAPVTLTDSGKQSFNGLASGSTGKDDVAYLDVSPSTATTVKAGTLTETKDLTNKWGETSGNAGQSRDDKDKDVTTKPAKPVIPGTEKVVAVDENPSNDYAPFKSERSFQNNEIRGRVVSNNNQPLSNANIRLGNSKRYVTTDQSGNFTVNSPDSVVVATVETPGFMDTRVELKTNSANTINLGRITLQPDPSFSDIAVTGLGTEKKKQRVADTLTSKPEGGWESFQQYVAGKLNIELDTTGRDMKLTGGELEIEFFVDANGAPKDFKIINSTDPALNQKAIDAVKKGPKWATRKKKARILIRY